MATVDPTHKAQALAQLTYAIADLQFIHDQINANQYSILLAARLLSNKCNQSLSLSSIVYGEAIA